MEEFLGMGEVIAKGQKANFRADGGFKKLGE